MRPAHEITLATSLTSPAPLLHRLLGRLVEADARYREARRLEDVPEDRLRDVGLTRADLARR